MTDKDILLLEVGDRVSVDPDPDNILAEVLDKEHRRVKIKMMGTNNVMWVRYDIIHRLSFSDMIKHVERLQRVVEAKNA
jgi:hypothetical protein